MTKYSSNTEKNFILTLAIIFVGLTIFVTKDIFSVLIFSVILAYFLYPLHNYYLQHFKNEKISAILTLTTAVLGLFLPLTFLVFFLALNMLTLIIQYREYIQNPELLNEIVSSFLENITGSQVLTEFDFSGIISSIVSFILNYMQNILATIPLLILYFFIILFIAYYLLVHNITIFKTVNKYLPLSLRRQNEVIRNIQKNIKVLFRGYFLTGLIQTAVAFVGYLIFGVPNLLIITFITLIISLIPYLGTPLVWVPLSIYFFVIGDTISGVGLLIYGTFVISLVDNFIRPVLMSDKETISPPLVFVGFVGGLFAFGLQGLILGPIIISITAILLRYLSEYYLTDN